MDYAYFQLTDDKRIPGRWFLGGLSTEQNGLLDPRVLTYGKPADLSGRLRLSLRREGKEMDFSLADFGMPVIRVELAEELSRVAPHDVQFFPVSIVGSTRSYAIMNIIRTMDCLDDARSGVTYAGDELGDSSGKRRYSVVACPHVDATRTGDANLLRIRGWEIVMIISERVRKILKQASGAQFIPAT